MAQGLWVLGSQYDDVIVGTRFDDDLEGNKGADLLQGGRGDDGIDELVGVFSRSDRDADRKEGGAGDDSLQATGGADVLDGGAGDDVLYEQSYDLAASMLGGSGDDDLLAWYDEDAGRVLDAGDGLDVLEVDSLGSDDPEGTTLVVDAGTGQVHSSVTTRAVLTVTGVERWQPSAEQPVDFVGTAGPDWVDGRDAYRLLAQTFAGDDVVKGSSYRDTIDAGDGYDKVDGRQGSGHLRQRRAGRASSPAQSLISQMTAPLVTVAPTSAWRPVTVPALCALSGCSIFIASMTTTVSPSATSWPSSTTTLTTVPCIGEVTASPLAAAPAFLPAARLGFLAPPPPPAEIAPSPPGSTTSSRLPPTSTTTDCRSSGSAASAESPA